MLSKVKEKLFSSDFDKLLNKLKIGENFAFSRFSDGELYVLQNRTLELTPEGSVIGDQKYPGRYLKEEQKSFIPDQHGEARDRLVKAFRHRQANYYKGLSCPCCATKENYEFQFTLAGQPSHLEEFTWANLLINANYPRFLKEMIPEIHKKPIIIVLNENARLDSLVANGFNIVKDFRVGTNCFINDYHIIEQMRSYIKENKIENHVFLVSAASLSNLIIYELFKEFPNNTFIDIGSTLNPILGLEGWKDSREYLMGYWHNRPSEFLQRACTWA